MKLLKTAQQCLVVVSHLTQDVPYVSLAFPILLARFAETLAKTLKKQQFRRFYDLRLSSFTDEDNRRLSKHLNCCFFSVLASVSANRAR